MKRKWIVEMHQIVTFHDTQAVSAETQEEAERIAAEYFDPSWDDANDCGVEIESCEEAGDDE